MRSATIICDHGGHADEQMLPNGMRIKGEQAFPGVCSTEKRNKAILPIERQFYQMAGDFYVSVYGKTSCSRVF